LTNKLTLLNYFGARKYASIHRGHFIETKPEGFVIVDKEIETILKWENISSVKVKMVAMVLNP